MICLATMLFAPMAFAVDLNESFENSFPPPGWTNLQIGDGLQTWYQTDVADNDGIYGVRSEEEVIAAGDTSKLWMILPPVVVDNVADEITFWARTRYSGTDDDTLFLLVSTTDDAPASFTAQLGAWIWGENLTTTFQQFSASLSAYVNDTVYVAFAHINPGYDDGSFDAMDIYLDDVLGPEILAPPYPASDPTPPDAEVGTDIATNLSWTNNGAVTIDLYLALSQDSVDNEIAEAKKIDNMAASLYNPPADLEQLATYYWKVVSRNDYGDTDSPVWTFTTTGVPLAGIYDIGGATPDFISFTEAISALQAAGISAPVTFDVYGGDYDEWVLFTGPIVGASATDTILFRDASGTARIVHGGDIGVSVGALQLDSVSYVIFDGIDVDVTSGVTRKCIGLRDGSSNNIIRNATLTGNGTSSSISYCMYMYSNDVKNNIFEDLYVTNARVAFNISAFSGDDYHSEGNIFRNNTIDNVWNGFIVSYAKSIFIHDNDIQLNGAGNSGSTFGLTREYGTAIDEIDFYNNKVHNIYTSSTSYGGGLANLDGGLTAGVVRVYNNFCYDFDSSIAQVRVFYLEDANGEIYNNSIYVNDVNSGTIYFNYFSGTSNHLIKNNIFYNGDPDNTAKGLYGTSTSYAPAEVDYNVWYYTTPSWLIHDFSSSDYVTLADMQAGTTYGDNGIEGDPGYTSSTDLHILNSVGTVSNMGLSIPYITTDIDGDVRTVTPDIGADEYLFLAPAADYRVVAIVDPLELYAELSAITIDVVVQNAGSATQTDVPVKLFYNDVEEDEVLITLTPEEIDTFSFTWNTPAAPSSGTLEAQSFLVGDANPNNDSTYVATAILGQDYAVLEILDQLPAYPENTAVTIEARIENQGSWAQTDISVKLFYDDIEKDEQLISLTPGELDTFSFTWNTGAAPTAGNLEVQAFLTNDQDLTDDSLFFATQVVSDPLAGTYTIGTTGDYTTFAAAVSDLILRGVSAPVIFQVEAETFAESISITAVPGASAVNTVTFEPAPAALDVPPELLGPAPVVLLDGVSYLTWDGINIIATSTDETFHATNGCSFVTLKNSTIVGGSSSSSSVYGVRFEGADSDNNLVDNVDVSESYYGIRFDGTSAIGGNSNNEIRNSHVVAKYGIYVSYQDGILIHDNDIEPRYTTGTASGVYGIEVYSQSEGDVVYVYDNEIHNFVSTGTSYGIYTYTGSGTGLARVYNNFVYDFVGLTGTATTYAVYYGTGSVAEVFFNSFYINPSSTGNIYGVYSSSTSNSINVKNNIFYFDVPTEECYGIYQSSSGPAFFETDYNCFYNTGTGLTVGRYYSTNYPTLLEWQGQGYDLNSIYTDPGYVGSTNLHIIPTIDEVDGMGIAIAGITTDFDGDTRDTPPDMGADEYDVTTLPNDYKVNQFIGLLPRYNSGATVTIQAEIENFGSANQTDVPVKLFYNGGEEDQLLISLTAGEIDTFDFSWTTPVTLAESGELEVQAFLPGDGFSANDSITAPVLITTPMVGIYDLGGGNNDYTAFATAISDLTTRGIDGEVIINVFGGNYAENVTVTEILGTNFVDRVIFRANPGTLDDVVTLNPAGSPVVNINGADFITFDGIDVVMSDLIGFEIQSDANFVTLKNLSITGGDSTATTSTLTSAVNLHRDGNDNCVLDNLKITGTYYGTRMNLGTGYCENHEIKNCSISGVGYGIYLDDVANAMVHDNEIQPYSASAANLYGIYLTSSPADAEIFIYNNHIHNFRWAGSTSGRDCDGIYAGPGSSTYGYYYNNFIHDFNSVGTGSIDVYGIYMSSGIHSAYNNSFHLADGISLGTIIRGIYTSTSNTTLYNNIFQIDEATATVTCVYISSSSYTIT
ncbi:choice-of-anchor J domain-containing protein, partial [bacterium]|nr:choice-of-anchor J domain-containing protein [bacterium]